MGAAWVDHPSFELVALASEVTGRDLAHLLLEADQDTLTRTDNAQIATFVQSLIVLDAAERIGIVPSACAGHSLGEYSALVAAGSLDFEDGLRLVAERGAAMQEAADYAPGNDDRSARSRRRERRGGLPAGRRRGLGGELQRTRPGDRRRHRPRPSREVGAIAKELGAKRVMPIPVGGAFHTPLMSGARDRLRKALARHYLPRPRARRSSPTWTPDCTTIPTEWPRLLSAQLCSPVRWRQTIDTLLAEGMQTFVELGPGGVLTGLVRRVLPTTDTIGVSVSTPDDLDRLVEILAGGVVGAAPAGEHFHMTERLVVSPALGLFEPADGPDRLSSRRDRAHRRTP